MEGWRERRRSRQIKTERLVAGGDGEREREGSLGDKEKSAVLSHLSSRSLARPLVRPPRASPRRPPGFYYPFSKTNVGSPRVTWDHLPYRRARAGVSRCQEQEADLAVEQEADLDVEQEADLAAEEPI